MIKEKSEVGEILEEDAKYKFGGEINLWYIWLLSEFIFLKIQRFFGNMNLSNNTDNRIY